MASGDTLIIANALALATPTTNPAGRDLRNEHPVLDFDAATDEVALLHGVLPRAYAGGGVTVRIGWMATSDTTGNVIWDAAFERHQASTDDLDSDSFATAQVSSAATTAGTSGQMVYTTIAFTNGAQMDSLAVGESFRLRVRRLGSNGSDSMTGDAELRTLEVYET